MMAEKQSYSLMERGYGIFRKIRFLASKGSLFTLKSPRKVLTANYPRHTYAFIFINSTVLFLLAYLLIAIITRLAIGFSALAFDIHTILFYYNIEFLIESDKWTTDAVQVVFSTGPLVALFIGILLFLLYEKVLEETGILRLLILWMVLHSLVFFLGEMLMGAIFNKGFGYVIIYLFFMDTGKMLISIFAMIIMVVLGLVLTPIFLSSGNIYFNFLDKGNRTKFIVNQFIFPFLVGNFLIFCIKIPEITLYEISTNATMLLILLPVVLKGINSKDLFFDEEPRVIRFSFVLAIITLLFAILYRIFFGMGIRI
ncbi:MAG: hypothetical protein WC886_07400 [Saccharofermentanaceae bacterium]|jgi:hypothetical protein